MPEEVKKTCICELHNEKYTCLATGTADCLVSQALQLEYAAYKAKLRKEIPDTTNNSKYDCTKCSLFYDYTKSNQK